MNKRCFDRNLPWGKQSAALGRHEGCAHWHLATGTPQLFQS